MRRQRDAALGRSELLSSQLADSRAELDRMLARVNDLFWTVEILPDGEALLTFLSSDASGVLGGQLRAGADAAALRRRVAHPDDAAVNAAFTAAMREGRPAEVEERLIGLDGVVRWAWSRGTPRRERGRLFFDGITTNVTERHELAEEREALLRREREQVVMLQEMHQTRDDFIALAGHELRTPLTVIQGYAEHLADDPTIGAEQRGQLEIVVRRAELMSDLIDDLFDLARLDSHLEPVEFTPVRLDELVRARVGVQASGSRGSGLSFRVEAEEAIVLGSRPRLERMFDNVIGNAVTYSPSGGEVVVSVTREGHEAVIRVADQGIGIPVDEREHVFTRLFRASNAVDGGYTGAGLGLSITQAIAESHGGSVAAAPDSSGGAAISVRLPLHQD